MTPEKVLEVIRTYQEDLYRSGYKPWRLLSEERTVSWTDADTHARLQHALWMLEELEEFVTERRMDKVFRWLGFVQGVLWSAGFRSIDEMRHDNMPSGGEFAPRVSKPEFPPNIEMRTNTKA
jgi:hypothetical protein